MGTLKIEFTTSKRNTSKYFLKFELPKSRLKLENRTIRASEILCLTLKMVFESENLELVCTFKGLVWKRESEKN